MKRVYISCSISDLAKHRQAALQAVKSLGWHVVDSVEHRQHVESLVTGSLNSLSHSDLFIGIYGVHYGEILPEEDVSLLEHLYQAAIDQQIPQLIYLVAPKEVWATDQLHTDERGAWMRIFWDKLHAENPHLRYFTTPDDLEEKIRFDLARLKPISPSQSKEMRSHLWWGILGLGIVLAILALLVLRIAL